MTADLRFSRAAIIGIGHQGGSIALAARQFDTVDEVVGFDADPATRARVETLGLVDRVSETLADAVHEADLILLCVPVGAMAGVADEMAGALDPAAVVTDVGSVKGLIARDVASRIPNRARVVPGHPIAGTEQSGPNSAFAQLFVGRWVILTPTPDTDAGAVERVSHFWRSIGARIEIMDPEHHDLVLAITSHIPHLIAYNIVGTAAHLEEITESEVIKFSAGGFRDFTRIAASDPTMWRDVFLSNREAVLEMLGRFSEDLTALQRAIRWGDGDALFDLFTRTRSIRRGIIEAGQETSAPDFGRRGGS
ncbi:MAG: prephenate/arogenate dehydrogenase family protein [Pseudomonadota bacterium]